MRYAALAPLVALVIVGAIVGCGGDIPTAPPTSGRPITGRVELRGGGQLQLPDWPCDNCRWTAVAENVGDGCARDVRGITNLTDDAGTVASNNWQIDPERIIRPGEQFEYGNCCFTSGELARAKNYTTFFDYTAVICP